MSTTKGSQPMHRLQAALSGHKHELLAAFARSAAHKLPASKGRLRENAVSRFLSAWVPRRFSPVSNVFATDPVLGEFESELDLVLHDSHDGACWPLDNDQENSIVTWKDVKVVFEVKSTLDEKTWTNACSVMTRLATWAGADNDNPHPLPLRVLFCFRTDDAFAHTFHEHCIYGSVGSIPFDAIVLLDQGATFGPRLEELEVGLRYGLVPSQVADDGPSQDKLLMRQLIETRIPHKFRSCGETPEEGLMALAALASLACSGEEITKSLLSALRDTRHNPIF